MKRLILIMVVMLTLTGCVNVKRSDYNEIINEAINSKEKIYNTYRKGYKFYLPHGLYISNSKEYNELIKSSDETYYLYIDLVSYLHKVDSNYKVNKNSYYSLNIEKDKKKGYLEINKKNDKYLVEIMYNYAKIEVMVDKEKDIKDVVANSIVILSSIYYNDNMLKNMNDDEALSYKDENVDIFNSDGGRDKSNFLEYVEEYDDATEDVPDTDKIK